ncbi:HpcH/HpaI aldolase/citrate lyase family protein [Streptomyces sp. NPDC001663]|uniref:HpcH/HpaI aldolase/citrate lyase family protein n=1 Tax=Streptomyces sp. NPDC001663 TaxID=3364597 RepID=UPI0036A4B00F
MRRPAPVRSLLAVPASSPKLLDSALRRPASALMVDLEDGVAPEDKDAARANASAFLAQAPSVTVTVRVNDPESVTGRSDLRMLDAHAGAVAAVVLPKATADRATSLLDRGSFSVIALIETPEGVEDALRIARQAGVVGLMFGSVDYTAELTAVGGWHASDLGWAKGRIVNAAAAGGVWALAGPSTVLEDGPELSADIETDRSLGFAGKLCIHPAQLARVNDGFAPSDEQIGWARRVLEAAEGSVGGAIRVDGRMVDKPVVDRARLIVDSVSKEVQP